LPICGSLRLMTRPTNEGLFQLVLGAMGCALLGAACGSPAGQSTGGPEETGGGATGGSALSSGGTPGVGGVAASAGGVVGGIGGVSPGSGGAGPGAGGVPASGVGGGPEPAGGTSQGSGGSPGGGSGWVEEWAMASSDRFGSRGDGATQANSGAIEPDAHDGLALQLTLGSGADPSPSGAAEVYSDELFQYGEVSARLKTADCGADANAGVVTGLFTYFNDGSDENGDGLPDNSEIDFEWLCADPSTVYLTVWTDYRDGDGAQRRVSRAVRVSTGEILWTCFYTSFGDCEEELTGDEASPGALPALPDYNSSHAFAEYGFEWRSDAVTFWMRQDGAAPKTVLWDYRGPAARIPARSSAILTNVWHTSDWSPPGLGAAIESPSQDVSAWVDWTKLSP
jgi:Glycosyl hydrolases family 16